MDKTYKLIIFDLGNVLLKFDHSISARKIAKYSSLSQDEIYDIFFNSRLAYYFDKGTVEPLQFFRLLKAKLKLKNLTYEEFIPIWENIFTPNWPVIKIVRTLKKKYQIYVISNANQLHAKFVLKKFKFFGLFDRIFMSYKLRLMKPHPDIYKLALSSAGVKPREVVFIDDRSEFLPAADRLGIKTINFINERHLINELKKMEVI